MTAPKFKTYGVEYRFGDKAFCVLLPALDRADAEKRLKALSWGRVIGEQVMELPGWLPGWLVDVVSIIRRWWVNP